MTTRTSGRLVAMMSLREVSGFSVGTMPAAASKGRVSSKMRPFDRAMVIWVTAKANESKRHSISLAGATLLVMDHLAIPAFLPQNAHVLTMFIKE